MTSGHFQKLQIHDGNTSNHTLLIVLLPKPCMFLLKPGVMLVCSCPKLGIPSILCIIECPRGKVPQPGPQRTTIRPHEGQEAPLFSTSKVSRSESSYSGPKFAKQSILHIVGPNLWSRRKKFLAQDPLGPPSDPQKDRNTPKFDHFPLESPRI